MSQLQNLVANPFGAALIGLFVGFLGSIVFALIAASQAGPRATLDFVHQNVAGLAGLLVATNILLGGILGVLLFQTTR